MLLTGRLDTSAVLQIEPQFVTGLVPGGKHAIVDLSKVDFISSMGIRMFISVARIMREKQAKLAFYAPQQMVSEVIQSRLAARDRSRLRQRRRRAQGRSRLSPAVLRVQSSPRALRH